MRTEDTDGWVEGGHDVPNWWVGVFISGVGGLLLLVVSLMALPAYGTNQDGHPGISGGSVVTPAPYGPPEPDRYRVPDPGVRPTPDMTRLPAPSLPLVGSTP